MTNCIKNASLLDAFTCNIPSHDQVRSVGLAYPLTCSIQVTIIMMKFDILSLEYKHG